MEMKPAIRDIRTIKWTEKTRYVKGLSSNDYKVLSFHGSTGNGKSMISTLKFMSRIYNSGRDEQNFILAGKDIVTLERRFVRSNHSVLNWYPFKGQWNYKRTGIGGSVITVKAKSGDKLIYLTPFNNKTAYERILGDTLHGVMIDEAVESSEEFLEEIMARLERTEGSWGIFTSNGGDPNHYFYTHILNRSVLIDELLEVDYATPIEEKKHIDKEGRREDFLYVYMRLEDNPVYSEKQLENFYQLYPVGSFMHHSRVLGVRGFSLNNPFAPYMLEDVYVKEEDLGEYYPANIIFSIDSGGHVFSQKELKVFKDRYGMWYSEYVDGDYGTGEGGHTGMLSVGFNMKYDKAVVLDVYFPNHMHTDVNVGRMFNRMTSIGGHFIRVRRPYAFVDSADTTMFAMFRDKKENEVGQIRAAVKRDSSIELDEQVVVTLIQQWLMRGQLKVADTISNRRWFVPAMISATLESDGKLFDNKDKEADVLDMIRYVFSSMYRILVRRGSN